MAGTITHRYWAFISYSNRDKTWARWLHRAIETYGIPPRLVGRPIATGDPAPKRFRPLFHDRAELPASADLGAQIEAALRASRYLIVICSPRAARSTWVNKEIETFLRLSSSDRVLAFIVGGEPNAGDERECFPAALRQLEPIAADARREGDGKSNAKLKLVAGMLGVGFDGLKQRDTHRRIRRLQLAIGLTLILAVGFAGLAMYAERQRKRAVRARQQAESLLRYLVFDLRDKLEPVGRLDILRDVQEKVDDYYRDWGNESIDPGTRRNQAVAFSNKGDRLMAQGDLAGALRAYRVSLQISERLAASNPSHVAWQRDVSSSHGRIGTVLQAQGDLGGALREYREYLAISERLATTGTSKAEWQRDVSVSHNRIGDVLQAQGDLGGALREYQAGLQLRQRLALIDPNNAEWQRDVSVSHNRIGDVLLARGDLVSALREYQAGLQGSAQLAAIDPGNTGWQRDVSVSHNRIGDVLQMQGDLKGALQEYQAGLQVSERLAEGDPTNAEWQRDVSVSRNRIGRTLQMQGDLKGALQEYQVSLQVCQRLVAIDSTHAGWQRDLSVSHNRIGEVLQEQGELEGALREYQAGLQVSERLAAIDSTHAGWQRDLSVSRNRIGDVLQAQGDLGGALREYRIGLLLRERLAAIDPSNAELQRGIFLSYVRLAAVSERAGQSEAVVWWGKAHAQLSRMKQRGILQPEDEQYLRELRPTSRG